MNDSNVGKEPEKKDMAFESKMTVVGEDVEAEDRKTMADMLTTNDAASSVKADEEEKKADIKPANLGPKSA